MQADTTRRARANAVSEATHGTTDERSESGAFRSGHASARAKRMDEESMRGSDGLETPAELIERAEDYAASVPLAVDLESVTWEVSRRAKRRAGACRYDPDSGDVTIRLTWAAYETFGWEEFSGVVRHELVHAHEFQEHGESGHGPRFRALADRVDAPRRCRRFVPPAYWVTCLDCEERLARYRRSKLVKHPDRYRCGSCGGRLAVESNGRE